MTDCKDFELKTHGLDNTGKCLGIEAPAKTPLAALIWHFNSTQIRVYWRGRSAQLLELVYVDQCRRDVNDITGSMQSAMRKNTGFAVVEWNCGRYKRIYFKGREGFVTELRWSGGEWAPEENIKALY